MSGLRRIVARLYAFCLPGRAERELTREVDAHLGLLEEEYLRRGMTSDDARRAARCHLRGVEGLKEQQRDARSFVWLDEARRDVRHAFRAIARTPGFTAIASLTIALGIGSVVTVFSVVHAVVLMPLPYDRPDQLVRLVETVPPAASPTGIAQRRITDSLSVGELDELRHRAKTVSHIASYLNAFLTLTDTGDTARLEGWRVEPPLFPMLRVRPLYGRALDATDAAVGAANVIVLGYGAWQRHLGGRPEVIGQSLTLDNKRYVIVGVMPAGFEFPVEFSSHDFWVPLSLDVTTKEAREVRSFSGVVLLIATIGLYGTVAYAVAQRTREIGIRVALGARRGHVMGFVLRRTAIVTIIGLVVGCAGALLVTRYLEGMLFGLSPVDIPTFVRVAFLFCSIATVATWVPARRALSVDPMIALRQD
jgi:MacB-like protein/FtsX-like permease family protein